MLKRLDSNKNRKVWSGKKSRKNDVWMCFECDEEYSEEDPHVWVECETYGEQYYLECSSIKYKTKDYWILNLDSCLSVLIVNSYLQVVKMEIGLDVPLKRATLKI